MHPHQQPESPRRKAGLLSQVLFIWMIPLFQKGYKKTLLLEDCYRVLPEDESRILGDRLERAWIKECERCRRKADLKGGKGKGPTPSLAKVLIRVYGANYAAFGFYAFYEECVVKVAQPICLGLLLRYFANPSDFEGYTGYLLGAFVTLLSVMYTSIDHPYTFACQHLGMKIRIALCSLIYRKALHTSKIALEETTAAQIVNFLSSDMNRFDLLLTFLHYIWVAPIQLGIVIAVLYTYLDIGWTCLTGIGLIVFFVPLQGLMGHVFSKLRSETASRTDRRLLLMEEIVGAIRVIKMYAWEGVFIDSVEEARLGEVKALRKTAYYKAINQSLFFVTSRITLFLTLLAYVLLGNKLTSEVVFVSLALYQNVQAVMTQYFPMGVTALAETLIAVKRFQDFLLLDDFHKPCCIEPEMMGDLSACRYLPDHDGGHEGSLASLSLPFTDLHGFEWDELQDSDQDQNRSVVEFRGGKKAKKRGRFGGGKGAKVDKNGDHLHVTWDNVGVIMKDLTAQWNSQSRDNAFNNVNLEVKRGEIVALIGPVGAGKGSVLQAILGELPSLSGQLEVRGRIGYCCQEPWIFPGSVRENILFGLEFESGWYDRVVEACALVKDFSLLAYGDHTLVGDRGTALSGGQRARINLARAVYADADVYLLDDVLSAVDAEVSRHLVEKCILGVLKDKARILVTHQLQYMSHMNRILLLIDGWPRFYGLYSELIISGVPYTDILRNHSFQSFHSQMSPNTSRTRTVGAASNHLRPTHKASSTTLVITNTAKTPLAPTYDIMYEETPNKQKSQLAGAPRNITPQGGEEEEDQDESAVEEDLGSGALSWRIYWDYLSFGTSCTALIIMFIVAILTQVVFTCSDFWLQYWIESEESDEMKTLDDQKEERAIQIGVYSALIAMLFVLCLIRSVNYYRICMQTSVTLHNKMFNGVIRSPMQFFDNNPMGRILNRFAKDIGVIDESMPSVSFDAAEIFLQSLGVIVVVSSSSPIMLVPAVIMAAIFYFIRNFYFLTARAIKRLEGVARSPVFAHISTTLYGITTIRAFGVESLFLKQFEEYLDVHSSVWYVFLSSSRWLGILVDWVSIFFVGCVLLNCLLMQKGDAVAGLAVTSAMVLTSMLQWGIRQSAELANQMISVERVQDYCSLPSEASWESDADFQPPDDWPQSGEIKVHNLSLKYRPNANTFVLSNLNLTIKAGEKVGVVGRTGAGKSALLSVLFRIAEPTEGFVEIDGIITQSIGLHDLRQRISIIPQEPVLFLGSIRRNLDPFEEHEDNEIWTVLKLVQLDEAVFDFALGLDAPISEGGTNFSTGQKQLFCLARAILRNNQILVLDECTANVDPQTDGLIQKTLRTNFAQCTVITIAHRLHTVMDSDRILVLDAGHILEFDEPDILLRDQNSALYQLVQLTGKTEASNLLHIAQHAAAQRRSLEEQL